MATDMFGNTLSPEEEERLRRHAEAMGMLPPALRIQMTSPFGGGVGPQLNQYQGITGSPRVPHHSQPGGYFEQNITPIPSDVTVDPTMAGMAGVTQDYGPFSPSLGALTSILAPAPPSSLPNYFDDPTVNEDMERLIAEEAATKVDDFAMIASQDPVSSLGGWIRDVTKPVELPEIVEKKQPYTSPMPVVPPGDMAPQTGFVPAPTNVDYSQVMTDAGIDPATAGMAEVSTAGSDFFGGGVDAPFDFAPDPVEEGEVHDVHRHLGLTLGVMPQEGPFKLGNLATTLLDSTARKNLRDVIDTKEQFLEEPTTDKLQDLINNTIAEDIDTSFTNQGLTQLEKYNQGLANPNIVYDKDSLNAMVGLAKKDYYKSEEQVQDAINEIATQVDSFKDVPTETFFEEAVTPVRTETISKRELQRLHQEKQDALAAQRKADLARQKAAAAAKRELTKLRNLQTAQDKARQKSDAAARAKQKSDAAKALKAIMATRERGTPSSAEINAMIEVMTEVDTFGSGGRQGAEGGRSSGAAIDSSDRGTGPF